MIQSVGSKKIAAAQKAQQTLTAEFDRVRKHLETSENLHEFHKNAILEIQTELENSSAQQENLRTAIQGINVENTKVREQRIQHKLLREELSKLRSMLSATRQQNDKVQKEVAEAERKLDFRQLLSREVCSLSDAREFKDVVSSNIRSAKKEYEDVLKCHHTAHENLIDLEKNFSDAKDQTKKLTQEIADAPLRVAAMTTDHEKLQAHSADSKERLNNMLQELGCLEEQVEKLIATKKRKNLIDQEAAPARLDILSSTTESERLHAESAKAKEELDKLYRQLSDLQELWDLWKYHQQKKIEMTSAIKENIEILVKKVHMESALSEMSLQDKAAAVEHEQLSLEKTHLQFSIEQATCDSLKLGQDLEDQFEVFSKSALENSALLHNEIKGVNKEVEDVSRQNEEMQKEIEDINNSIQMYEQAHEASQIGLGQKFAAKWLGRGDRIQSTLQRTAFQVLQNKGPSQERVAALRIIERVAPKDDKEQILGLLADNIDDANQAVREAAVDALLNVGGRQKLVKEINKSLSPKLVRPRSKCAYLPCPSVFRPHRPLQVQWHLQDEKRKIVRDSGLRSSGSNLITSTHESSHESVH
eukprot:gnl/MRDRNA2_/MRDRNA2_89461_c0_seq1.p1 gnl/MRDRNA2_/MRDRNA2_89461_c0~~gnl/MRDRNA2_/MRDRNA2_89461_c0_seq1.p1  ORF type:complete len:589 (+),score=172.69 gnl/MRDRNA2_/MRDRNA2_89461_c0_seq1:152-1918(+)